ncbi:hypothetical protein [Spongiactinospora sp. 9N601]|uniref:hypothetical protein n=1 Tax=Spongiactinospora sp. 9N601 TaxID=3375149 RepID=UPI003798BC7A
MGDMPTGQEAFAVWEVEAGDRGACGVTDNRATAQREMVRALESFPRGRGRVRLAWPAPGLVYRYGETLVTAHRYGRVFVSVRGDAWEAGPPWTC